MKILIVSGGFHPLISPRAFRATELAIEFARQGHEVVASIPEQGHDYAAFTKEHNVTVRPFGRAKYRPVRLKGRGPELLIRRAVRRFAGLLFEYPGIELMFRVASFLRRESGYDLLVSIAVPYPIHWGVARARKKKHPIARIWIADCGDPYMGDTTDSFRKMFYFKYLEKWFCRKADFITIPFEGARPAYYKEFHPKIRVVPQGFRMDNLALPAYRKVTDYPVFGYAGGFIPEKRDPGKLLAFLSGVEKEFRFIVYTNQAPMLLPHKKRLKEKLEIREYIPREELLKVLAGMDFLLNFDNNTHTQLPSKLIDYALTGRPVLNVTAGNDFDTLQEFLEGDYSGKMDLDPPDNYNIRVVAGKFINMLNE